MTNVCEKNCHYCACRGGAGRAPHPVRARRAARAACTVPTWWMASSGARAREPVGAWGSARRPAWSASAAHAFSGYVHLKLLPGASRRARRANHRASINLEAPSAGSHCPPQGLFWRQLTEPMRFAQALHRRQWRAAGARRPQDPTRWAAPGEPDVPVGDGPALSRHGSPPGLALCFQPVPAAPRRPSQPGASTASTRPTGCCASTGLPLTTWLLPHNGTPAEATPSDTVRPSPSLPSRVLTAPRAASYCASRAWAPRRWANPAMAPPGHPGVPAGRPAPGGARSGPHPSSRSSQMPPRN